MRAIWKAAYVSDSTDGASIEVKADGETVYTGIMNVPPGEDEWSFNAQEIAKDYVSSGYPNIGRGGTSLNIHVPTISVLVDGTSVSSDTFVPDWSYDPAHDLTDMAAPIDGVIDPRMYLPYSFTGTSARVVTAMVRSRTVVQVPVVDENGEPTGETTTQVQETTSMVSSSSQTSATFEVDVSSFPNAFQVDIEEHMYTVQSTCKRYALYYLNAYGGWDAFVPQGKQMRTDRYARDEYKRQSSPSLFDVRSRVNYVNNVTPSWSLTTGMLSDDAASRMHHLLGSTNVYLHDMEEGIIYAVIMKNTSASYLTASNNGRTFPTYTIEVELAKDQFRR